MGPLKGMTVRNVGRWGTGDREIVCFRRSLLLFANVIMEGVFEEVRFINVPIGILDYHRKWMEGHKNRMRFLAN